MRRAFATRGLLAAVGLAAGPLLADEAQVRQLLRGRLPPAMVIESVAKSPIAGLYEVVLDGEIVYTDEKAEYFFGGNIFDIRSMPPRNLTLGRTNELLVQALTEARDLAIKQVNGAGARLLFTFEDPNCGYCKALRRELAKLDNVTVYTFLLPILSQDSADKALAVWCAPDRLRAWDELMSNGVVPAQARACPNPLERIAALARRFQISSTPAIYLVDGRRIGGMRSAAEIEKALGAGR